MKRRADILAPTGRRRDIAYPFVLDALDGANPTTRPMFGSHAVYLDDRVLFILRKKDDDDDGVWVAFDEEREADARAALPNLVRIERLPNVRSWRKLAADSPTFEDDVLEACRIALSPNAPIGKIPIRQKARRVAKLAPRGARNLAADAAATKTKPRSPKKGEAAPTSQAKKRKKKPVKEARAAAPGKRRRG